MNKKLLIWGVVVLIAIVIGAIYFYPNPQPEPQTYDECVQQILNDVQKYKPASEEPIGAKRTDEEGRVWIKSDEINQWDFDGNPIPGAYAWKSDKSQGSLLTDDAVDEFPGGANYMPESFPECEKYIFTPNNEMEQRFSEIVNEVIQEQSQKGITISVEEIEVLNLAGRLQGFINLNCESMDYETEEEVIGSIANKLFVEYPNEFAENSERDSWVDVHCDYDMGWRISDGYYDMMI